MCAWLFLWFAYAIKKLIAVGKVVIASNLSWFKWEKLFSDIQKQFMIFPLLLTYSERKMRSSARFIDAFNHWMVKHRLKSIRNSSNRIGMWWVWAEFLFLHNGKWQSKVGRRGRSRYKFHIYTNTVRMQMLTQWQRKGYITAAYRSNKYCSLPSNSTMLYTKNQGKYANEIFIECKSIRTTSKTNDIMYWSQ